MQNDFASVQNGFVSVRNAGASVQNDSAPRLEDFVSVRRCFAPVQKFFASPEKARYEMPGHLAFAHKSGASAHRYVERRPPFGEVVTKEPVAMQNAGDTVQTY